MGTTENTECTEIGTEKLNSFFMLSMVEVVCSVVSVLSVVEMRSGVRARRWRRALIARRLSSSPSKWFPDCLLQRPVNDGSYVALRNRGAAPQTAGLPLPVKPPPPSPSPGSRAPYLNGLGRGFVSGGLGQIRRDRMERRRARTQACGVADCRENDRKQACRCH